MQHGLPLPENCQAQARCSDEAPRDAWKRRFYAFAWNMNPSRWLNCVGLGLVVLKRASSFTAGLPHPDEALDWAGGLCGLLDDWSVETLHEAYCRGIYPLAHAAPTKLWCPPQRWVLRLGVPSDVAKLPRPVMRRIRMGEYALSFDTAFADVVAGCRARSRGRSPLTWLRPVHCEAFLRLHEAGLAHSYEVWNADGALVGGGFGVAIGRIFVAESQFSRESGASQVALAGLIAHLAQWGFTLCDAKVCSPMVEAMGFRPMPRADYLAALECDGRGVQKAGPWRTEHDNGQIAEFWRQARTSKAA
jgi:leucyl/phenylalanyl-tRNA--protein transferase